MNFTETKLKSAFIIDPKRIEDARGFFAMAWCRKTFAAQGLDENLVQANISYSPRMGTLRGVHFQKPPHAQPKLVRCTRGAIWDVAIDLRTDSPTYRQWVGVELTADNRRMFWVPRGFAHGFITLKDDTEVFYQMSEAYQPGSEGGVRWNDPAYGIDWPAEPAVISERDAGYPLVGDEGEGA